MKKIISALMIGVVVVAMLAMLVAPVLAVSGSHQEGTGGIGWGIYAKGTGEWLTSDPTKFTASDAWADVWGASTSQTYFVDGPGISTVYSEVTGQAWTGLYVHAWAWLSPPAYPLRYGGDYETWT